jgi:hypothetical protein
MSPACIAQFLGSAVSFSTSGLAQAPPALANNDPMAKAPVIADLSKKFMLSPDGL